MFDKLFDIVLLQIKYIFAVDQQLLKILLNKI